MTNNLALWDRLSKTDPAHTKNFKRAGGFSGTAIKPMWSYRRMTEEFGPCGTGWGVCEPTFQVVSGVEGEQLVFCTASIWYGPEKNLVFGVGGDKAVGKNKYGLASDDEAFKKAFTDAITNALKLIGVGADVHMGMFDDSKYVNTLRDEFAENDAKTKKESAPKPVSAAEMKRGLEAIDQDLLDCQTIADVNKCAKIWASIMDRDGWSEDYREVAKPKFAARREALANETVDTIQETFPGSTVKERQYGDELLAG